MNNEDKPKNGKGLTFDEGILENISAGCCGSYVVPYPRVSRWGRRG